MNASEFYQRVFKYHTPEKVADILTDPTVISEYGLLLVENWVEELDLRKREIYVDGAPYLTRYFLSPADGHELGPERRLIHNFHTDDQDPRPHNHPWDWAWSVILSGGYTEIRIRGFSEEHGVHWKTESFGPGSINRLSGLDYHRVVGVQPNTWTLFVHGPKVKPWGFLDSPPAMTDWDADGRPNQLHGDA